MKVIVEKIKVNETLEKLKNLDTASVVSVVKEAVHVIDKMKIYIADVFELLDETMDLHTDTEDFVAEYRSLIVRSRELGITP